ncbi:hypothetical protein DHEL01_v212116 [Diaporthe helianthi]|uniref:Uncharacterized protein n=1 Tax=Diaporthe helianthi TaxID=158607 RepID=A0A2P5HGV9_DIAHE|nr:hypothetical protein DHEL01_v212116 [Diaporthe helianthi]
MIEFIETESQDPGDTGFSKSVVPKISSRMASIGGELASELHNVELLLFQHGVVQLSLCQAVIFRRNAAVDSPELIHLLYSGLSAARTMLDFYLSLPIHAEMIFNNSEWIQLGFAITAAARLAIIARRTQAQGVGPKYDLQSILPLSKLLRHISLRIGALATRKEDSEGVKDTFQDFERRVHRIQEWFERYSTSDSAQAYPVVDGGGSGGGSNTHPAGGQSYAVQQQQIAVSFPPPFFGSHNLLNPALTPPSSVNHLHLPPTTMAATTMPPTTLTPTFRSPALVGRPSQETSLHDAYINTPALPDLHDVDRAFPFFKDQYEANNLDPRAFQGTLSNDTCDYGDLFPELDDIFRGW